MTIAVPIVAGTAIKGLAANVMMRGVMERHPNAFLVTLQSFGVSIPLHRSQATIRQDIEVGLKSRGLPADAPLVLVGHSQGALAALRFAIDDPERVLHVFSVGCPWRGSRTADALSQTVQRLTRKNLTPALVDMAPDSPFLQELHSDVKLIADRVTNVYSTHEIFIRPYTSAHIDVAGVTNILIASEREYERHLRCFPELIVDQLIVGRVTHAGEMNRPEVRSLVWTKVEQLNARLKSQRWADDLEHTNRLKKVRQAKGGSSGKAVGS